MVIGGYLFPLERLGGVWELDIRSILVDARRPLRQDALRVHIILPFCVEMHVEGLGNLAYANRLDRVIKLVSIRYDLSRCIIRAISSIQRSVPIFRVNSFSRGVKLPLTLV